MITALDHIVLLCPDAGAARSDMQTLLGLDEPTWNGETEDGTVITEFRTMNTAIECVTPPGDIAEPGLKSLVFQVPSIEDAHHTYSRRGLNPGEITSTDATDKVTGERRSWKRFRLDDEKCHGAKIFIMQRTSTINVWEPATDAALRLDHLVINTPNPERAVALYGGRLGLPLKLDRTIEQFNTRFLFFVVGGLILEIIHRTDKPSDPEGPDSLWGLTWATQDLEACRDRLERGGVNVSEIRTGRKPGSTVFTARDHAQGVPTLFIHHAPR